MSSIQETSGDVKPVPYLRFDPTSVEHEVVARYVANTRTYLLSFGDGTPAVLLHGAASSRHTYEQAGVYTITARTPVNEGRELITQEVCVARDGTEPQGVTLAAAPDNDSILRATFGATEPGTVVPHLNIDWGDGKSEDVWAVPGTHMDHALPYGTHTVGVRDWQTRRRTQVEVELPAPTYDPNFTVREAPGSHDPRMVVEVELTAVTAGKPVLVDWYEDFTDPTRIDNPQVGSKVQFTYPTAGLKAPVAAYEDGSGTPNYEPTVTVPFTT